MSGHASENHRPSQEARRVELEDILACVRQYWGFENLRPFQEQAIRAGLDRRDSLVVLPTGGGKSLCYQTPPLLDDRTDVVISPLISLMKDQVDALSAYGYPAGAIHSGMSSRDRDRCLGEFSAGRLRLLFVSPERLMNAGFTGLLKKRGVRAFSIDEAHCISHWGHDFRPEYRRLNELRERFPDASFHAFTATATERVRRDMIEQLKLANPEVIVGSFDRPNLTYRIVPRHNVKQQVLDAVQRHGNEAVIVYCISRKNTESMADHLCSAGVRAACYHAGLDADRRRSIQDDFANERIDVVVATVAFGMGIDRSNVRCVIHAAMPKSIEHYQQETGRAGRDGLEAECILFYASSDVMKWRSLFEKSAQEAGQGAEAIEPQLELLEHLRRYCQPIRCRHRQLLEYFGQTYDREDCGACDVCLNETEELEDAGLVAKKILSCVARVEQRFGAKHIVDVLRGGDTAMIRKWNHERLSTYGLMKDTPRKDLSNMVDQLVDQRLLDRTGDGFHTLRLNGSSWQVMRGELSVRLCQPPSEAASPSSSQDESWAGVDRGLFDELRTLRREIADRAGIKPYIVFSDATLRQMARRRPRSQETFGLLSGVGDRKLSEFGGQFAACIDAYCREYGLEENIADAGPVARRPRGKPGPAVLKAFDMFDNRASVEDVMQALDRARSTTSGYLAMYIEARRPDDIGGWVESALYRRIADVAARVGADRLKPIFQALDGKVSYDDIRLVVTHLNVGSAIRVKEGPFDCPASGPSPDPEVPNAPGSS